MRKVCLQYCGAHTHRTGSYGSAGPGYMAQSGTIGQAERLPGYWVMWTLIDPEPLS